MPYERDPNEIGALWAKENAKGDYLTGEINGVKVVCFRNRSTNEKAPTWRVLRSVPREGAPGRAPHDANARQVNDSDIPF